jgi:hypothetical protein
MDQAVDPWGFLQDLLFWPGVKSIEDRGRQEMPPAAWDPG